MRSIGYDIIAEIREREINRFCAFGTLCTPDKPPACYITITWLRILYNIIQAYRPVFYIMAAWRK